MDLSTGEPDERWEVKKISGDANQAFGERRWMMG
jgi:hypothetical protein